MLAPFPTFLIIGARRNATRWLRFNLDAHPEILAPPHAVDFFTDAERMSRLGLRWYREQFREWDGEPIVGEASWSYLGGPQQAIGVPGRIRKVLPDIRLVAIIANPLDRFHSRIRDMVRRGELPAGLDIDGVTVLLERPDLTQSVVTEGLQGVALRPYVDVFGDQLLIITLDDVRADPVGTYRSVLRHLGADDSFVPDGLDQVRYSNQPAIELPEPSLEARQSLYAWYRPDVEILEDLTGRDLSAWDPGTSETTPTTEEILEHLRAGVA